MEQRYERSRFSEVTDRSEAPLPDALALLVRETLTGQAPRPRPAPWSICGARGSKAARRTVLDRMPDMLFDQEAFGRLTRDLLAALNLADQLDQRGEEKPSPNESEADADAVQRREEDSADGEQRADLAARFPRRRGLHRARRRSRTGKTARPTGSTATSTLPSCRAAPSRGAPICRCSMTPKPSATRCSPAPTTRSSMPRSCATPTSSTACAPFSTSSSRRCTARWRGSPTGSSAGCSPSRTAAGTSTSTKA